MKKVLVISTVPFDTSGIITVIMNYYRAMDKSLIKFHFVTPLIKQEKYFDELNKNDDILVELGSRSKILRYIIRLNKYIRKNKFDVVHVHGNSSTIAIELLIARLHNIKIRIAHSHNSTSTYKFLHRILSPLFKITYNRALACSDEAGKWLYGRRTFTVLNNGIDLEKFKFSYQKRKNIRKKYGVLENDLVLLHVGFFNYQKNHEFLLTIMANKEVRDNFKLILVGDGPNFADIKKKSIELGIVDSIIFAGKQDDVSSFFSASDIFLLPSRYEGFPLVLVEAQANGLKCIVSSNLSTMTNLTGDVTYLSIDENPINWIEKIQTPSINRMEISIRNKQCLKNKGYEISDISSNLRGLYLGSGAKL